MLSLKWTYSEVYISSGSCTNCVLLQNLQRLAFVDSVVQIEHIAASPNQSHDDFWWLFNDFYSDLYSFHQCWWLKTLFFVALLTVLPNLFLLTTAQPVQSAWTFTDRGITPNLSCSSCIQLSKLSCEHPACLFLCLQQSLWVILHLNCSMFVLASCWWLLKGVLYLKMKNTSSFSQTHFVVSKPVGRFSVQHKIHFKEWCSSSFPCNTNE